MIATDNTAQAMQAQYGRVRDGLLIRWTEFPDVKAHRKAEHTHAWPELLEHLQAAGPFPAKDAAPLLVLGAFGIKRTKDHALRHAANLLQLTGIIGDYDAEAVSMAEALARLERAGIRAAIYPTARHTDERPRWRVLCPLANPAQPADHSRLVARLNGALGGILAGESFTLSQSFFFGRIEGKPWQVLATWGDPEEGHCLDELPELDAIAVGKPSLTADPATGTAGPVELGIFADRVQALGRKLREGDGRRDLLKIFAASRSARGLPYDDLRLILRGAAGDYFDPADPVDWANVDEMAAHFARKDYREPVDVSSLLADPETGEIFPATPDEPHPLARYQVAEGEQFQQPEFVLDGVMVAGMVLLAGAWGAGKTTQLVPLMFRAAHLCPPDDPLRPLLRRRVIYIAEDVPQVRGVIRSMREAGELDGIDADEVNDWFRLVAAHRLPPSEIVKAAADFARLSHINTHPDTGVQHEAHACVVIDTRSAVIDLENEDHNTEVSAAISTMRQGLPLNPLVMVGHLAKSLKRADVRDLSGRGAGAWEADVQQVMYLVKDDDGIRWLDIATPKHRFVESLDGIEFTARRSTVLAVNPLGDLVEVPLVHGVPCLVDSGKRAEAEQVKKQQAAEGEAAAVRFLALNYIRQATAAGETVNRSTVKAHIGGKAAAATAAIAELIGMGWVHELEIPKAERVNNNQRHRLVALTDEQHQAWLTTRQLPDFPSVPGGNERNQTEGGA